MMSEISHTVSPHIRFSPRNLTQCCALPVSIKTLTLLTKSNVAGSKVLSQIRLRTVCNPIVTYAMEPITSAICCLTSIRYHLNGVRVSAERSRRTPIPSAEFSRRFTSPRFPKDLDLTSLQQKCRSHERPFSLFALEPYLPPSCAALSKRASRKRRTLST
jgi:hypothetical protein